MFRKLKKIKPGRLLTHAVVTLSYPIIRALRSETHRLLVFADTMTIIALLLLVAGILYALALHGDFDRSRFVLQRGLSKGEQQSFEAFMSDRKKEREGAFNYPLFLGLVYIAAAMILAYGVL